MLNKLLASAFIVLFFHCANAQMSVPFTIGGLRISESSVCQMNYLFVDSGKCLRIANGLNLFSPKDPLLINKVFKAGCIELPTVLACPVTGFPNPTKNFVKIISKNCFNNVAWIKGSLQVTNSSGQILKSVDVLSSDIRNGYRVDLSKQSSGVYYITVSFQDQSETIKIIKVYGN